MKKLLVFLFTIALIFGLSGQAAALILDFDSTPTGIFDEITEDGFRLTWVGYGDKQTVADVGGGNHVLKDSAHNVYGAGVTISTVSGDNFFFNSLDYNNFNNNSDYGNYRIDVWAFPDPWDWATATLLELRPTSSTFSTLTASDLGVAGIELAQLRVNLVSYLADYSVDNINLAPVPEPATMLLLGTGLVGLVGLRKKFKK